VPSLPHPIRLCNVLGSRLGPATGECSSLARESKSDLLGDSPAAGQASSQSSSQTGAAATPDFEQALAELENLVARLESGDLPLDVALQTFERGVALTRQCQSALKAAQQKVEILLKRSADAGVEPFAISDDDAPGVS
jgi:exodeoxyribonuclease VII small subunit